MINSIIPYAIKGVLWYQGETNAGRAAQYETAFPLMIKAVSYTHLDVYKRQVQINSATTSNAYGLNPEVSWNKGISIDQKLRLFSRSSTLSFDFFRNDFENQVVVDIEDPRYVRFYNLAGKSFSNSFQAEWSAAVSYTHLDVYKRQPQNWA